MVPFVTASLALHYLPPALAPADLAVYYHGSAPAYRLTPTVFARLHHAADKISRRPELDPSAVSKLVADIDAVYDVLLAAGYSSADVHAFDAATTPPLPPLTDVAVITMLDAANSLPPQGAREGDSEDVYGSEQRIARPIEWIHYRPAARVVKRQAARGATRKEKAAAQAVSTVDLF